MILAVSGSTANTADPLAGNGVTPVYAGGQFLFVLNLESLLLMQVDNILFCK